MSHLVELHGGWSAWKWLLVRGAGFPARHVLDLASPDLANADDDLDAAAYARERERTGRVLRAVVASPRFQEAVLWQNRRALHGGMAWLLAHPDETNRRARQNLQLVASYLQRYCVKNDTIGFFGPVGWGELTERDDALAVAPGPTLLTTRTVYFEHWAIDAIAQSLATIPEIRAAARPRRMPTVRLDGSTIYYPTNKRGDLPAAYARLLAACDGQRTAREIASDADELAMLGELADKRFVTWTLEVPTVTEWPERHLRALLAAADENARDGASRVIDELETRRAAVAAAAGDPDRLDRALGELDACFERTTARSATRKPGETYAARTLVYEDCRRHLQVDLGRGLRRHLGPPLALVLQSARWYTYRLAALYRDALTRAFDEAAGGADSLDYLAYWQHAKALFPEDRSPSALVTRATGELQRTWSEIAKLPAGARAVSLACGEMADQVAELFAAPHPGWPSARYHSPDLLISARSVEDIRAGRAVFVLGELHPSVCTIHHLAQKEHPDRAALIRARELDLPDPIPTPVYAKEHATRSDHMWLSAHDLDIELGTTRSWRARDQVIAVGSLVVAREQGRLRVRERDGTRSFDIVEFFGAYLNAAIANSFEIFPLVDHAPRVSFDGLVVARERWCPGPDELAFARADPGPAQLAAARAWRRSRGLPRWVFARVPEENKPIYVDFDSPIYVELFAKLIRKGSRVVVGEMLPDPEHAWLPDADGNTYTCELRMVAVDPQRWEPV